MSGAGIVQTRPARTGLFSQRAFIGKNKWGMKMKKKKKKKKHKAMRETLYQPRTAGT